MKVKELIEKLSTFDQEMEVIIPADCHNGDDFVYVDDARESAVGNWAKSYKVIVRGFLKDECINKKPVILIS